MTPEIKLSVGYLAAEEIPNAKIDIDTELNIESENAIANKTVTEAINEINEKIDNIEIPNISDLATKEELETVNSSLMESIESKADASDLDNFATKEEIPDVSGFALKTEIPDTYTKTEIDDLLGIYIDEVDALIGGEVNG